MILKLNYIYTTDSN